MNTNPRIELIYVKYHDEPQGQIITSAQGPLESLEDYQKVVDTIKRTLGGEQECATGDLKTLFPYIHKMISSYYESKSNG